ncbi:tetratricopeptide repeat protein [Pontimicrobium sp. SW4]|uniref:Tetratricopeptide repeat protein n=1 Tax=Pontimicrobium sp. SW4 TaxID=3153519 RepID=A0AAU7BNV6_9FLAO
MKNAPILFVIVVLFTACGQKSNKSIEFSEPQVEVVQINTHQGTTLLGKELINRQLDQKRDSARISNYLLAKKRYDKNPNDAEAIIWVGRRMAYLGDFKEAIKIFTEGIEKFPEDARMYRHRGHRLISTRKYDEAIADFNIAVKLIEGTEDVVEPDGAPNVRNIPVSSLHTNIWYHLGLAYYLQNNMDKAYWAYNESLKGSTNPDMKVASANWVYMILRRMGKEEEAKKVVESITAEMDVFENMAYHQLCLFYKGEITEKELLGENDQEVEYMNDAIVYGLGNWYLYNGNNEKAKELFTKLVDKGVSAGFAVLSAEADLVRMMKEEE